VEADLEHDLDKGLGALRNGLETYLITLHTVLPLLVRRGRSLVLEITDGDDMSTSATAAPCSST
jgi:hypothetical protein